MRICLLLALLPLITPACVPNCDPSYCSGNTCSKCIEEYYYNPTYQLCYAKCPNQGTFYRNGSCFNCTTGCTACLNENICTTCSFEYKLNSTFQCIKCGQGYRFDSTTKSCMACPRANCDTCDSYECLTCEENKYKYTAYNSDDNSPCENYFYCQKCLDECPAGTMTQADKSCFKCPSGCLTCDTNQYYGCYSCKEGYYLSGTTCEPCGCNNCSSSYISCDTTCAKKFYPVQIVSRAVCSPCADNNCDDCSADTCFNCSAGYFKNSSRNQCQACSKPYCSTCQDDICTACKPGYIYNSENKNCGTTSTYICFSGYYYDFDYYQCRRCSVSNCYSCPNKICDSCIYPYFLSSKSKTCIDASCPQSKYFNESLESCVSCSESNCLICQNNICSYCNQANGYYLNSSKKCFYNGAGGNSGNNANNSTNNSTNTNAASDESSTTTLALILIIAIASTILVIMLIYYLTVRCKQRKNQAARELLANQNNQNNQNKKHVPYQRDLQPEIRVQHPKPQPQSQEYREKGLKQDVIYQNSNMKKKNVVSEFVPEKLNLDFPGFEDMDHQQPNQAQQSEVSDHQSFHAEELFQSNEQSFHAPPLQLAFEYPETIDANLEQHNSSNVKINIEKEVAFKGEEKHQIDREKIQLNENEIQQKQIEFQNIPEEKVDLANQDNFVPIELKIDLVEEINIKSISE